MKYGSLLITLYLLFGAWFPSVAQNMPADSLGKNTIIVENADHVSVILEDETYVKYLNGNVRILHDSSFFYCDQATIRDNDMEALGHVVILQKDSTTLFSDTLRYHADSLKAWLNGRVLLRHQGKELKTKAMEYKVDQKIAFYTRNGQLSQDSALLKSRTGIYKIREDLVYFKDFVSITDSAFSLKADSLKYDTKLKKAYFTGPTHILQDSANIYCESGYYDLEKNNAEFSEKVVFLENDTKARAVKMWYIDAENAFILAGNARYIDKEQDVRADTIRYLRKEETSILIGHVNVRTQNEFITGDHIIYHHDSGDFKAHGRSRMQQDEIILTADHIDYRDEAGDGLASGNILLVDTISKTTIYCDQLITSDKHKQFIAFNDSINRPRMEKILDADTLFLSADTLVSRERVIDTDTFQMIHAFHDVRIFQENFQAVSDSLLYDSKDSVFILFNDPLLWSDSTQFSGDTISIFMKNDRVSRLFLRQNAFIISDQGGLLYDQIAGRQIEAFFIQDTIRSMQTRGNAESLYYLKDESEAFIGAIKTVCSHMEFIFNANELENIRYFEEPVSNMTTIKQEIIRPQRLTGFSWQIQRKPPDRQVHVKSTARKAKPVPPGAGAEETIPQNDETDEYEID